MPNNSSALPEAKQLSHIGFIMDGNRRWARARGLPTLEGHRRGYDKLKDVGGWCIDRGIRQMTVYAFSTENWNRSKEEVAYLMELLEQGLRNEVESFLERGIRLRVIGRRHGLPSGVLDAIDHAERQTLACEKGTLYVAINYGGRPEIIDAVNAAREHIPPNAPLTEDDLSKHLYAPEVASVDLIIRTSGEQRTSGFLLWQAAYSELYFTAVHWPDFSEADLDGALSWYTDRDRRFGV